MLLTGHEGTYPFWVVSDKVEIVDISDLEGYLCWETFEGSTAEYSQGLQSRLGWAQKEISDARVRSIGAD